MKNFSSNATNHSCFALLAVAILVLCNAASAVIKLGHIQDLDFDPILTNLSLGVRAGMDAAITQQNLRGGIKGQQIQVVTEEGDVQFFTSYATASEKLMTTHPDITAFMGTVANEHLTSMANTTLKPRGLLHFAPMSSNSLPRFYEPTNVFIRPDPDAEINAIVEGITKTLRLKKVALMLTIYGGPPMINYESLTKRAQAAGLEWSANFTYDYRAAATCQNIPSCIARGNTTFDVVSALTTFLFTKPDAVVITGFLDLDTFEFMVGLLIHPLAVTVPNLKFFVTESHANLAVIAFGIAGVDPTGRIYSTFTFPVATDTSFEVIRNFQRDMLAVHGADYMRKFEPYAAVAGYITARFTLNALTRADDLTPASIRRAVYSSTIFEIDDLTYGVFKDGCPASRKTLCECNDGSSRVDFAVYDKDRYWQLIDGASSYSWPISECGAANVPIVQPVNYIQLLASQSGVDQAVAPRLRSGIAAAEQTSSLSPTPSDVRNVTIGTAGSLGTQLGELDASLFTAAALGGTVAAPELAAAIAELTAASFTSGDTAPTLWPFVDPFSPRATLAPGFTRQLLHTSVTLQQEFHVAAATAQNRAAGKLTLVALAADAGAFEDSFKRSCTTFEVDSEVVASASLAAAAAGLGSAMYFVTGLRSAADAAAVGAAAVRGATVIVAHDEYGAWYDDLAAAIPATNAAAAARLLVATQLPNWGPAGATDLAADYRGSSAAAAASPHPLELRAFAAARAAAAVHTSISRGPITAERFLSTWYDTATHLVDASLVLGPYFGTACGAGGDSANCGCNVGARRVRVWSLAAARASAGTNTDPAFEYTFGGCAIAYTEPEEEGLGTTAVIGLAVGICAALAIGAIVAARLTRGSARDVGLAPKDASKPYTLVFTDIQSSTSLWARAPEVMGPALESHHQIIRRLIAKHRGYEVKTIGDAFMIAFASPDDAVALCRELQQEFYRFDWGTDAIDETYRQLELQAAEEAVDKTEPPTAKLPAPLYAKMWNGLRVRCGVHTGIGDIKFDEITKGYDYYGNVPNVAARTEASGNGGQVLLTKAVADSLSGDQTALTDLGPFNLRGVPEPVQLFQLSAVEGRQYAGLRQIDDKEDDNISTHSGQTGDAGASGELESLASGMSNAQMKKQTNAVFAFDEGLQVLFSTQDPKKTNAMLAELSRRWAVRSAATEVKRQNSELVDGLTARVAGVMKNRQQEEVHRLEADGSHHLGESQQDESPMSSSLKPIHSQGEKYITSNGVE